MAWRYLFGIFILILGAGFLAEQIQPTASVQWHFIDVLSLWWPVFIIAVGLNQLFRRVERPWGSLALVAISSCLLIYTQDKLPTSPTGWLGLIVTLVGIMLGIRMLLPRRTRKRESRTTLTPKGKSVRFDHTLKEFQLFSGIQFHNESQQFQGGRVSTVFGETEVDLRGAVLAQKGADLKLNAVFGNIIIRVPQEMVVSISGAPILGNIDNNTTQIVSVEAGRPILRLKCLALVSAIEITN